MSAPMVGKYDPEVYRERYEGNREAAKIMLKGLEQRDIPKSERPAYAAAAQVFATLAQADATMVLVSALRLRP